MPIKFICYKFGNENSYKRVSCPEFGGHTHFTLRESWDLIQNNDRDFMFIEHKTEIDVTGKMCVLMLNAVKEEEIKFPPRKLNEIIRAGGFTKYIGAIDGQTIEKNN